MPGRRINSLAFHSRFGMRVVHSGGDHLLVLNDAEAASVAEACALMVLAVKSDGRLLMPPVMNRVLCDLFEGLRVAPPLPGYGQDV
jgi:hypothetical protein